MSASSPFIPEGKKAVNIDQCFPDHLYIGVQTFTNDRHVLGLCDDHSTD